MKKNIDTKYYGKEVTEYVDIQERTLKMFPGIPYMGEDFIGSISNGLVRPHEFSGWRNEVLSWKKTAYLGAGGVTLSPTYIFSGPDSIAFLKKYFVNNFDKFPVGSAKHAIACREDGKIMIDGVLIRLEEDLFYTCWLNPYIQYLVETCGMNVSGKDITGKVFLLQIGGPKSLEILEKVSGDNLHDIAFAHERKSIIAGKEVFILRMGMAGSLSYEVHAKAEDYPTVYKAIWSVGEPLGMEKLGGYTYVMNHTENGFPQAYQHFAYPWFEDPGFVEYEKEHPGIGSRMKDFICAGTYSRNSADYWRDPIELGWEKMINANHDFIGKEALLKLKSSPVRKMVTLEWDADDVGAVLAEELRGTDVEPYTTYKRNIYCARDMGFSEGSRRVYPADAVCVNGKVVGVSSGRTHSIYYRRMISLCSIDIEYAEIGNEVTVIWGEIGGKQKAIKAKVARFPYFNENRNEVIDVNTLPIYTGK